MLCYATNVPSSQKSPDIHLHVDMVSNPSSTHEYGLDYKDSEKVRNAKTQKSYVAKQLKDTNSAKDCKDPPGYAGTCESAIPMWTFDNGNCKPFTYGGCNGNKNKFSSKEKCLKMCVQITDETEKTGGKKGFRGITDYLWHFLS